VIVFNLGTLIWILWTLPFLWWSPELNFDREPVAMSAMIIALVYNLPQILAGLFTLRHAKWAMWMGFVFALMNGLFTVAGQFGLMNTFGNLYDATPGLRVMMFGLIGSLLFCLVALYGVAIYAARFLPQPRATILRRR
jgi:hypothetical protein